MLITVVKSNMTAVRESLMNLREILSELKEFMFLSCFIVHWLRSEERGLVGMGVEGWGAGAQPSVRRVERSVVLRPTLAKTLLKSTKSLSRVSVAVPCFLPGSTLRKVLHVAEVLFVQFCNSLRE